jgi:hypothetical protein
MYYALFDKNLIGKAVVDLTSKTRVYLFYSFSRPSGGSLWSIIVGDHRLQRLSRYFTFISRGER